MGKPRTGRGLLRTPTLIQQKRKSGKARKFRVFFPYIEAFLTIREKPPGGFCRPLAKKTDIAGGRSWENNGRVGAKNISTVKSVMLCCHSLPLAPFRGPELPPGPAWTRPRPPTTFVTAETPRGERRSSAATVTKRGRAGGVRAQGSDQGCGNFAGESFSISAKEGDKTVDKTHLQRVFPAFSGPTKRKC